MASPIQNRNIPSPWGAAAIERFLSGYFYSAQAFLINAIERAIPEEGMLQASCHAGSTWLVSPHQMGDPDWHPRHVSGADLITLTGSLGSLHAYFFHQCLWEDGWVGFGNRIEQAEFKKLARIDLPLELVSKETKVRRGQSRTLLELEFAFSQEGAPVYTSKQTAMFLKK